MTLGERLKIARERRNKTQEDLAELATVSQARISALENRKSQSTKALFPLAAALKVSPRWLLTGEEPSGLDSLLPDYDETLREIRQISEALSAPAREKLLAYCEGLRHSIADNVAQQDELTLPAPAPQRGYSAKAKQ